MRLIWVGVLLSFAFQDLNALAQANPDEESAYIEDAFVKAKIPLPELGWVLPNGELVTEVDASEVTILSEKTEPQVAKRAGLIVAESVRDFASKNQVDCDQLNKDKPTTLYRYATKTPPAKRATQVLVLAGRNDQIVQAEIRPTQLSQAHAQAIWEAMDSQVGEKRLIHTLSAKSGHVFISIASTYGKDGKIFREGRFFQNGSGKILGSSIQTITEDTLCDGCDMPTFAYDSKQRPSWVFNLVLIPGMPNPVILEDSSTVEGRAIELFTFSEAGNPSTYRKYEYMVTCVLGSKK